MSSIAVEGRGLSLARGGRVILADVDIRVSGGEVVTLLGPNGAGKSTLLALLAGDLPPDAGEVRLAGMPLAALSPRERARRRSVLTQRNEVAFGFRVDEVVGMARAVWRGDPTQLDEASALVTALRAAELDAFADREATTLSGGEAARMGLARALVQDAPLLLLDEPAAALDIRHREQLHRLLRQLAAAGCGVLIVGHDLDAAAAWSDRIVLLDRGHVVGAGTPRAVLQPALLERIYGCPIEVFEHPGGDGLVIRPARQVTPAAVAQATRASARVG